GAGSSPSTPAWQDHHAATAGAGCAGCHAVETGRAPDPAPVTAARWHAVAHPAVAAGGGPAHAAASCHGCHGGDIAGVPGGGWATGWAIGWATRPAPATEREAASAAALADWLSSTAH
ncbi:MAG: hypothetical protein AAF677_09885, partial [Pseudomonadota bacterium]